MAGFDIYTVKKEVNMEFLSVVLAFLLDIAKEVALQMIIQYGIDIFEQVYDYYYK